MANDFKWIGWDKPETIVSRLAMRVRNADAYVKLSRPGTFRFNDGTTQGWKIDQLSDTNDPTMTQIPPFTHPSTGKFCGFSLSNHQNLGLAAGAYPLIVTGSKATSLDLSLESPDLLTNQGWSNVQGYSLDLQRNFFSYCADPPVYYAQLQVKVYDKQAKEMTIYGEKDEKTEQFVFHPVKAFQPYHFIWTADVFTDPNSELRSLRVRLVQPNLTAPGAGECLPKGQWLVGNISPES